MRRALIRTLAAALVGVAVGAAHAEPQTVGGWSATHAQAGFFSDSYSVVPPAAGGTLEMAFDDCHDVELHAITVDGRGVALSADGRVADAALLPGGAALLVTVTGLAGAAGPGRAPARYALLVRLGDPELRAEAR